MNQTENNMKMEEDNEDLSEENEEFVKQTEEHFENVWKEVKEEVKDFSKKELAKHMFVSGVLMYQRFADEEMQKSFQYMRDHPEEIEEMLKKGAGEDGELWSEGTFAETVSQEEAKIKDRTIHMKHDEEMNYNCKECDQKISAHNKDWHAGMCDSCFNKKYFPD